MHDWLHGNSHKAPWFCRPKEPSIFRQGMGGLGWERGFSKLNLVVYRQGGLGLVSALIFSVLPHQCIGILAGCRRSVITLFPIRSKSWTNGMRTNVNPVSSDIGQRSRGFKIGPRSWVNLCFQDTSQSASTFWLSRLQTHKFTEQPLRRWLGMCAFSLEAHNCDLFLSIRIQPKSPPPPWHVCGSIGNRTQGLVNDKQVFYYWPVSLTPTLSSKEALYPGTISSTSTWHLYHVTLNLIITLCYPSNI